MGRRADEKEKEQKNSLKLHLLSEHTRSTESNAFSLVWRINCAKRGIGIFNRFRLTGEGLTLVFSVGKASRPYNH